MNSHARFAARAAQALGYGFRSLDGADGYLFEISDGVRTAAFPVGYATPYALNRAHAYSLARDKAFAARVLAEAGLATIPGRLFFVTDRQAAHRSPGRERADALAWAAAEAVFPLFCKPNQGSKGEFAEIVADAAGFEAYLARVAGFYDAVLVQPLLRGREHRVLTLEGRALCAYEKTPPMLLGDGRASVAALIAAARGGWKPAAQLQPIEAYRARDRAGRALGLDFVPAAGAQIMLEGRANRAAGGDAAAIVTAVPPGLAEIATRAAAALGLVFAGVDVFDLSPARAGENLVIIEVNANPALETLEAQGRFDLIETIWAANFAAALT
ncbi:MAG: RimK family alpha-L-glutamate ligase [Hyphomonadaceae bacterium]